MLMKTPLKNIVLSAIAFLSLTSCSSILKIDRSEERLSHKEYDEKIVVKPLEEKPMVITQIDEKKPQKTKTKSLKQSKKSKKVEGKAAVSVTSHQPSLEDAEGFTGRRPNVDPFRVGEKVTFNISYFKVVAGELTLQVMPFVEVNGVKSYHFRIHIKSNDFFSKIYAVDDVADTYVDYEQLRPFSHTIDVKEAKQLASIRSVYDWQTGKGSYWHKKITKDKGEEKKEFSWDLAPYSQNVVSAIFYLRNFTLRDKKKVAFNMADEDKNLIFRGEVVRKEQLDTDAGEFNTVVVKPQFEVDGLFKPVGDILIWMTDDDRKLIVRIESKIRIGTLVAKLKSIEKGTP